MQLCWRKKAKGCRVAMVGTDRARYHLQNMFLDHDFIFDGLAVKLLQILSFLAMTNYLLRQVNLKHSNIP
jgi:hypothetical protein